MPDVWACSQCRSLNQGKDRCYKCRSPRAVAGVAPAELPTIGLAERTGPVGRYRSSAFRAVLVSVALLALATVGIIHTVLSGVILTSLAGDGPRVVGAAAALTLLPVVLARLGLLLATLILFAAWLSRVVANIPPLTGAYPQATPRSTIVEVLIPFFNFFRIPAIVREALRLLDPGRNGDALIAAAIFPLIVGLLGDWPGGILATIVIAALADSVKQATNMAVAYSLALSASVAIGSVILVAVIARIERASAARARERFPDG